MKPSIVPYFLGLTRALFWRISMICQFWGRQSSQELFSLSCLWFVSCSHDQWPIGALSCTQLQKDDDMQHYRHHGPGINEMPIHGLVAAVDSFLLLRSVIGSLLQQSYILLIAPLWLAVTVLLLVKMREWKSKRIIATFLPLKIRDSTKNLYSLRSSRQFSLNEKGVPAIQLSGLVHLSV